MVQVSGEAIKEALDGLRQGFQADGADLELVEVGKSSVTIRLVFTEQTCVDCIVPGPLLHQIVTATLEPLWRGPVSVNVIDPRTVDAAGKT